MDLQDYIDKGLAATEAENFTQAIEYFDQAIEIDSSSYEAYNERGWAKFMLEDFKGALKDFNKSIRLNDKDNAEAFNRKGVLLLEDNQSLKARNTFSRAIQLAPNNAIFYTNKATANSKLNYYNEAVKDLNKAQSLDPNNPEVFIQRASMYESLEKYSSAMADYIWALVLDPHQEDAIEGKNDLYKSLLFKSDSLSKAQNPSSVNPWGIFFIIMFIFLLIATCSA